MGGVKMGFNGKHYEFLLHFKLGQLNHQSHIQRRIFTLKFRNKNTRTHFRCTICSNFADNLSGHLLEFIKHLIPLLTLPLPTNSSIQYPVSSIQYPVSSIQYPVAFPHKNHDKFFIIFCEFTTSFSRENFSSLN